MYASNWNAMQKIWLGFPFIPNKPQSLCANIRLFYHDLCEFSVCIHHKEVLNSGYQIAWQKVLLFQFVFENYLT